MKHIFIFLVCFCLNTHSLFAGEIEIPESVKKSFVQKFPSAQDVRWDGDATTHYEVEFVIDGKEKTAIFLVDGTFKEIETEIKLSELPKRVVKSIEKKFPLSKIVFALKVQRRNNSDAYVVAVDTGIEELDITLDAMGYEVE